MIGTVAQRLAGSIVCLCVVYAWPIFFGQTFRERLPFAFRFYGRLELSWALHVRSVDGDRLADRTMYTNEEEALGSCVSLGVVRKSRKKSSHGGGKDFLGGVPEVYGQEMLQLLPVTCPMCNEPMPMVCQVNTPLEGWFRMLYLFSCNSTECHSNDPSKAWRALRWQRRIAPTPQPALESSKTSSEGEASASAPKSDESGWAADAAGDGWENIVDADEDDWGAGGDDDDWGQVGEADTTSASEKSTAASKREQTETSAAAGGSNADGVAPGADEAVAASGDVDLLPADVATKLPRHRQTRLDFVDEPYDEGSDYYTSKIPKADLEALSAASSQPNQGSTNSGGGGGGAGKGGGFAGEGYESTPAAYKYFMKFSRRLDRDRRQCIRYAFDGRPLWCVQRCLR